MGVHTNGSSSKKKLQLSDNRVYNGARFNCPTPQNSKPKWPAHQVEKVPRLMQFGKSSKQAAAKVMKKAYAPYSNFRVGAALLTTKATFS